ncbi:plasmid maintenance protein [Borreliella burgdorferi]|uniref:plasmid maintenance protein n=1 Tax=Borreliella burgdorferi TaxID=139 RepID=UPI00017F2A41|nr:plasmid maintenance protein [Borreliella burgdorferi]MCD2320098.1 plasmid maintenance protein [Borreliella burgdorferi]MCD2383572.1 plasmid maintenance protein [Borreliella burgdorferi]MCD2389834.1 plasmid maintenance protein [Borreliella burgdorferi]MCD2394102.1 plasmid maintenance protein [Borreliella burgdorferi]MCD2395858.1 plasmid maintenance protein [Borreliella burgdorferi]
MYQIKTNKMPFNKVVDRRLKIFWVIQKLSANYFISKKKYSLSNVVAMTNSILEKKGFKRVTKRTIQNDIKIFETLGLIKSHFNPLGKNNGSFTYYTINKALEKLAKKIISTAYFIDKKTKHEKSKNKQLKKIKIIEESQKYKISHQITSHVLSNNISKKYKNSKYSFKRKNQDIKKTINFLEKKIKKKSKSINLEEIKKITENDITYKNSLWNLKDFMEELKEYEEKKIIKFYKKNLEKKKQKIWFMAKKFKNTDFDRLIKEFKIKNKMEREKNYENENQIHTSNNIKNATVLIKTLIKKQKYDKKIKK